MRIGDGLELLGRAGSGVSRMTSHVHIISLASA